MGRLIARAQKGFFFEMGQEEMSPKYNIPGMNGDPKAWLESLLKDSSEGRSVAYLGDAEVFVNKGKDKAYRLIYFVGE